MCTCIVSARRRVPKRRLCGETKALFRLMAILFYAHSEWSGKALKAQKQLLMLRQNEPIASASGTSAAIKCQMYQKRTQPSGGLAFFEGNIPIINGL
jgi:hypothetical protein